jgi:hypothetical protein
VGWAVVSVWAGWQANAKGVGRLAGLEKKGNPLKIDF